MYLKLLSCGISLASKGKWNRTRHQIKIGLCSDASRMKSSQTLRVSLVHNSMPREWRHLACSETQKMTELPKRNSADEDFESEL